MPRGSRDRIAARIAGIGLLVAIASATAAHAEIRSFSNLDGVTIESVSKATPFPSIILVSGMRGPVVKVRVVLNDLAHTFPADIEMMLVGPAGQSLILMSDLGGSTDITGVDIGFDDAAAGGIPLGTALTSGLYKPTNVGPVTAFPAPAPAVPNVFTLAGFNGSNPNGIWSLYIRDDSSQDGGTLGSWSVTIAPEPAATSVTALGALATVAAHSAYIRRRPPT